MKRASRSGQLRRRSAKRPFPVLVQVQALRLAVPGTMSETGIGEGEILDNGYEPFGVEISVAQKGLWLRSQSDCS